MTKIKIEFLVHVPLTVLQNAQHTTKNNGYYKYFVIFVRRSMIEKAIFQRQILLKIRSFSKSVNQPTIFILYCR